MKQTASDYYQSKKGNCAQSVTYALAQRGYAPAEAIVEMRACGGGRAPEKMCGALYAAVHFAPSPAQSEELQRRFADVAGGVTACPQVRAAGKIVCAQCVETAAGLADELF